MVYITRNFYGIHLLIVISYHKIFHSRHITPPGRNLSFSEMMSHIGYNRCISIMDITVTDIYSFISSLGKLVRDRRFNHFVLPVDEEHVQDYYTIIQNPLSLSDMMSKIDQSQYNKIEEFLDDINLIRSNAVELYNFIAYLNINLKIVLKIRYNPDKDIEGRQIRHAAHALVDMTKALLDIEMDDDFPEKLEAILTLKTLYLHYLSLSIY